MDEKRNFSKYLVIFIDALGSRGRKGFDEQYRVNSIFHDEFERNKNSAPDHVIHQRKIYTFSDCAYIFYGYKDGIDDSRKDEGKLFNVALCNCEPLFLKLLSEHIVFRGGITYGDAYVDPDRAMFFGEAVNKAYEMESKHAIYPRVLVDDYIAQTLEKHFEELNKQLQTEIEVYSNIRGYDSLLGESLLSPDPSTGYGIVEKDTDKQYIYNYLHGPENNMPFYCSMSETGEAFIRDIIAFCNEQIGRFNDKRIVEKYRYLKRFCESKI